MPYTTSMLAIFALTIATWAAPPLPAPLESLAEDAVTAEAFVYIDGAVQNLIPRPTVIDGQLYVPMRPVAEALGITSRWLPDKGIVQLDYGRRTLTLRRSQLVVTAEATLVPLRRLTDLVGAELKWTPPSACAGQHHAAGDRAAPSTSAQS